MEEGASSGLRSGSGATASGLATLSGYSGYVSATGYGLEALAQVAQGIAAAKRAKAVAQYNRDIAAYNSEVQAQTVEYNTQAAAQAAENDARQLERHVTLAHQDIEQAEEIQAWQDTSAQQAQAWREARQRDQQARLTGHTRAIIGASGLLMEGSPLVMYEDMVRQVGLDIAAQRYQTQLERTAQHYATAQHIRGSEEAATQATYGASLARYGAAERLRVGGRQAALLRAGPDEFPTDTSQVGAGLMKATGTLLQGASVYAYQAERAKKD
jgi:hypothetical protein